MKFILTPVNWDLMLHIHLFSKLLPSSSSLPIQHLWSPIPTKSSLPLYVSFIQHPPFLFSFLLCLVSSPSPFVHPSCYFQHWTPVFHSHPVIPLHLLLSVSCPLFFIFHALNHLYVVFLSNTLSVTVSSISPSHFLCASL